VQQEGDGKMKKLITVCVVGLLVASVQAGEYDFESLGTGSINGKDGWTSTGLNGYVTTPGGYTSAGSGICVTTYGGTAASYGTRANDATWGYDLSGVTTFSMGAAIRVDYNVSGYYGRAEMLLTNSISGRSFGFGYEVLPWYYSPYIHDSLGTEINLGNLGMSKGTAVDMRMDVDLTGEGLATLWANKDDTGWVQYGAPQSLQLMTAVALPTLMDGVRLEVKTRLGAFDDLYVTPEPATMVLLMGGALPVLLRRKRS
jgi:hypothetical protein